MNKRSLLLSILIVITAAVVLVTVRQKPASAPSTTSSGDAVKSSVEAEKTVTAPPSEHVRGNVESKVTFVEYADFQCPACGAYFPILNDVENKYKDTVKFQFRNYPLTQIHENGMNSAVAAEAAGMQGKFWEMHNELYKNQSEWSTLKNPYPVFEQYALKIGINAIQFKADYDNEKTKAVVQADMAEGKKLGIDSTPTIVINGSIVGSNPTSVDGFSELIDAALAAQN